MPTTKGTKKGEKEGFKQVASNIYFVGVKNGGILMKNRILRGLNRDWKLFTTKAELDLLVKVMKKINRIK